MLFMQFNTFTCSYLLYKNNGDNHTLVCGYIIVQIFKLTSWNMQFVDSLELINIQFFSFCTFIFTRNINVYSIFIRLKLPNRNFAKHNLVSDTEQV